MPHFSNALSNLSFFSVASLYYSPEYTSIKCLLRQFLMTSIAKNKLFEPLSIFLSHFLFFSLSHFFSTLIAGNLIVLVIVGTKRVIYFKSEVLQWKYQKVVKLLDS